jgi:predicted outer membrane repeat protein
VNSQGTLNLNKLTIADGYVAGATFGYSGGIFNGGRLTVSNSTFSGNSGYGEGGGIATYGALTLKNTIVANNRPVGNERHLLEPATWTRTGNPKASSQRITCNFRIPELHSIPGSR